MDALQFLKKAKLKPEPIYVLAGDEDFLKRQALARIRPLVIGDADPEFATARFEDAPDFSAVRNELQTAPFLAPAFCLDTATRTTPSHRGTIGVVLLTPSVHRPPTASG